MLSLALLRKNKSCHNGLDSFEVGYHVESNGVMMNAVRNKKTVSQNVPRTVYGQRLIIVAMPIIDDTDNIFGTFSVFLPKLHPVAAAFKDFAPVLAEMFDEGSVIYMTDLTQVVYRQASRKFDISSLPVGHIIQEEDVASRTIKTKKPISEESGAEIYGFPVLETNYPLFDEDNPDEIVASLGVIIPKKQQHTCALFQEILKTACLQFLQRLKSSQRRLRVFTPTNKI